MGRMSTLPSNHRCQSTVLKETRNTEFNQGKSSTSFIVSSFLHLTTELLMEGALLHLCRLSDSPTPLSYNAL